MAFAASGNVIPATGNINFNSNASSNAVRQVFGEATSNMQGLVGSDYNTSTRPPPFTVTTANQVPAAASGNLKLSFFAGKSLFLTAPTTYTISNITTSNVTPTLSGGGTSYYIAVGTAAGGSTLTNGWVSATSGTAITKQTGGLVNLSFTVGSSYYISAHASNATNSTSSLAVSNTSAYGIPNPATGVTLTITSLTAWSMSWTAPALGISPSNYSWSINTSSTVPNSTAGYFGTTTSVSASGTAALSGGTTYYATVYATRPESTSVIAASAGVLSLSAPGSFTITSMTTTVVNFSWTAVSGATSYTLTYSGTSSGTVPGIPAGSTYAWTHGFTSGGWTCTLAAVAGGTGPSSGAAYFGVFITPTTGTTYTPPIAKAYTVTVVGAGGGGASGSYQSTAGSGGIIRASGSLAATAYTVQVGGAGGAGTAGTNGGGTGGSTGLGSVAGGGGGFSQFGSPRGASLSITAGGGGGASYSSGGMVDDNYTESYAVGNGGNGGVTTSFNGTAGQTQSITNTYVCGCPPSYPTSSATANGGGGGTGGAVGAGGSGGTAGSTTTGGTGGGGYKNYSGYKSAAGGGGGGGYYGGGGGGWDIENLSGNLGESVASGGGGGSSFKGASFSADLSGGTGGAGAGANGWVLIYG